MEDDSVNENLQPSKHACGVPLGVWPGKGDACSITVRVIKELSTLVHYTEAAETVT